MEKNKVHWNNWKWGLLALLLAIIACVYDGPVGNDIIQTDTTPTSTQVMGESTGDWYEVYFTSPVTPFDNVYTGGIEEHLIDKINAAQSTIDMAVFEFDIESVAQALINAKSRGVIVRAVYDNEYSDPDPQIGELKNAGISTIPDNRSAYMHDKFFVFDEKCIWTGSFNISLNAAYRNNENAIYFCSTEAAINYTKEFTEMFSGQFGSSSPSDTPYPVFTIDGVQIENYFASEDHVLDKIISAVSVAQTSIHFMAFSFTEDSLADEMLVKSGTGVTVEGIFETTGANTQYSECANLLNNGLDVRLDGNPRTFHHKVIIIDGKVVIFGSYNFTSNADNQNDENLLIVHDPNLALEFEQEYQRMKLQAVKPTGNVCKK